MFAFCVWDKVEKCLLLARDRFGEKPLYYTFFDNTFAFASQLNSISSIPSFSADIDPDSALQYFDKGFVPSPRSILKGVHKLPPASYIGSIFLICMVSWHPQIYWSLPYASTKRFDHLMSL